MKKILHNNRLFWVLIFIILTVNQIKGQSIKPASLVGEWSRAQHDYEYCYVFCSNREYKELVFGNNFFNGWGRVKYEILFERDTSWLMIRYKRADINGCWVKNFFDRKVMWLNGDYLTVALYKKGKGINNHIDEYSVLVRKTENPTKVEYTGKRIKYIIPEGFTGSVWIAFNQPLGTPPTYDSIGNPTLTIPSNGLLETTLREDVFATANGYYNVLGKDRTVKGYKVYESFDKFDRIDTTTIKPDIYYAFIGGFNQTSRKEINSIFQKAIGGNVLTIFIGKYEWFNENPLHPWDSKME